MHAPSQDSEIAPKLSGEGVGRPADKSHLPVHFDKGPLRRSLEQAAKADPTLTSINLASSAEFVALSSRDSYHGLDRYRPHPLMPLCKRSCALRGPNDLPSSPYLFWYSTQGASDKDAHDSGARWGARRGPFGWMSNQYICISCRRTSCIASSMAHACACSMPCRSTLMPSSSTAHAPTPLPHCCTRHGCGY